MEDRIRAGSPTSFGRRRVVQTLKLVGGHAYLAPWLWRGFARSGHGLRALLCANPELEDCGLPTAPKLSRYGTVHPYLPSLTICDPPDPARIRSFAAAHGFPLVMKPLFGSRSRSVLKILSLDSLMSRKITEPMILQPFVDLRREYGVSISRRDGTFRIYAVTEVALASGREGVIPKHECQRLGTTSGFHDVTDAVSERLVSACDAAAAQIGLNFGRFDVKAASLKALMAGDFRILEANGPLAVNLAFYDDAVPMRKRIEKLRVHWTELLLHSRTRVAVDLNAWRVLRDFARYFLTPRRYAVSLGQEVDYRDLTAGA